MTTKEIKRYNTQVIKEAKFFTSRLPLVCKMFLTGTADVTASGVSVAALRADFEAVCALRGIPCNRSAVLEAVLGGARRVVCGGNTTLIKWGKLEAATCFEGEALSLVDTLGGEAVSFSAALTEDTALSFPRYVLLEGGIIAKQTKGKTAEGDAIIRTAYASAREAFSLDYVTDAIGGFLYGYYVRELGCKLTATAEAHYWTFAEAVAARKAEEAAAAARVAALHKSQAVQEAASAEEALIGRIFAEEEALAEAEARVAEARSAKVEEAKKRTRK